MSEEEDAKSPSDWVDSPLFKDDEDEFESIISTPPPVGYTKDEKGNICMEEYDFRSNRVIKRSSHSKDELERQKGYRDNRPKESFSVTSFMGEHIRRERESLGMEKTLDMDFGFEKEIWAEICGFRDSEVNAVEVLEGTDGPMIAVGSLEKLMIVNYSTCELVCDLGCQRKGIDTEPWTVDEMLYLKKHRTLYVSIHNVLEYVEVSQKEEEGGEEKVGDLKFKHTENLSGLDEIIQQVGEGTWKNHNKILRTRSNDVSDDSFLFRMNVKRSAYSEGAGYFAIFDASKDSIHVVPGVGCEDRAVPLIHPKQDETLIIASKNRIDFKNYVTGGTVDVTKHVRIDNNDSISSLGYIDNKESGALIIGTKSGEICFLDLHKDEIRRKILKFEKEVLFILTSSKYFICGSETQRAYVTHLDRRYIRKAMRRNISVVTNMKWCLVYQYDNPEEEPQYFVTSDRNGCLCAWRNIFHFEKKDRMERCKSVLFECLESSYEEETNDSRLIIFTIKVWGKEIFVMKSLL